MSTEPAVKLKRGYVREDGMVFLRYNKKRNRDGAVEWREHWLTREAFDVERQRLIDSATAFNARQEAEDPEGVKERRRAYQILNRDALNEKSRIWQRNNRPKMLKMISRWREKAVLRDPSIRAFSALRARIHWFAGKRTGEEFRTLTLLGVASRAEFKDILASRFEPGMTWDNYGKWELDHIVPCSAFKPFSPTHLSVCFHHSNMAPMWMSPHRSKKDRVTDAAFDVVCARAPDTHVAVLRALQERRRVVPLANLEPEPETQPACPAVSAP